MHDSNREQLIIAARLLRPLLGELVFVGGTVTGLLITDEAAAGPRTTLDVDAIAEVGYALDSGKRPQSRVGQTIAFCVLPGTGSAPALTDDKKRSSVPRHSMWMQSPKSHPTRNMQRLAIGCERWGSKKTREKGRRCVGGSTTEQRST